MDACNDNGRADLRVLEARFHPDGQANEFIVIGNIVCHARYAVVRMSPGFAARVPRALSARAIASNLFCLAVMSRPRPFECFLSLDNPYWSFVPI
jgi:hypothetical protein